MTVRQLIGDCRVTLPVLDAGSVQAVVTSPPYYGLRDYGLSPLVWGGDDHEHEWGEEARSGQRQRNGAAGGLHEGRATNGLADIVTLNPGTGQFCPCGAWLGSLGLEPTPDLYVEHLVEVFCHVRRVLRDDGVLWLNLGSSYFGGGQTNRQGFVDTGAQPYGTSDKAPADCPASGWSSRNLCDVCAEVIRGDRNARTESPLAHEQDDGSRDPSRAHMESLSVHRANSDYALRKQTRLSWSSSPDPARSEAPSGERPLSSPESTPPQSLPQPPDECSHCSNCGACLSVQRSSSRDARECVRKTGDLHATGSIVAAIRDLCERTLDTGTIDDSSLRRIAGRVSGSAHTDSTKASHHYKPKDEMLLPFRVALALQNDGWYVRSVIPWLKRNPMPESVTDRPATAVEYVFLLSKSARYFWDADAVRVASAAPDRVRRNEPIGGANGASVRHGAQSVIEGTQSSRSRRNSDWFFESWQGLLLDEQDDPLALVVNPMPFTGAHFATFAPKLVEPMIKASTSEKGQCPECRAPWVRVVEKGSVAPEPEHRGGVRLEQGQAGNGTIGARFSKLSGQEQMAWRAEHPDTTTGWRPSCKHEAEPVPQTVLDCFGGAGTVGLVSDRLQRNAILCELSKAYAPMAANRITSDAPMFSEVLA